MTIKLLLLKSGEDVIADITEMTVGEEKRVVGYFLGKPYRVEIKDPFVSSSQEGPQKTGLEVSLIPWMPLTLDTPIPITADWLITMVEPIDKLKKMYLEDVVNYGKDNKSFGTDESAVSDK